MTSADPYPDRTPGDARPIGTVVRLLAALTVLVSGLVHLQLYYDGYRDFPDANLGRSFVLNGVSSVVVAAALVVRRDLVVRAAAAVLLISTIIAFALSRTDSGIFGFTEKGLEPSPQAGLALSMEIVGLVLLAATLLPVIGPGAELPRPIALASVVVLVVVAVGGAALFAREDSVATAPAGDSAVSIVDFSFEAPVLEVAVGTTVVWTNNDSTAHSVVAEEGAFESETLDPGATFSFTFTTPGEFAYVCGIHPTMKGSIVVTG